MERLTPSWGGTGHGSKTDASTRAVDSRQITPDSAEIFEIAVVIPARWLEHSCRLYVDLEQ
jgi:hypothetical protein